MHGKDVCLSGVSISYPNGYTAVETTDLNINSGEFFSILGPSGCGKTTILKTISGFLDPSAGTIKIGGVDQTGLPPNARPTALIFQNLALFPLMSIWENVAFGLEARGVSKAQRKARALELLELVALRDQAHKKPDELSGGQKQRVAIARALAVEPAVLLLDEPLSALDLKLRQHMRAELRAIQKQTGVTFIYITHDQGEALTMSDRIAVMNNGRIEQIGTGDQIYSNPHTAFVASFVGETNRIEGRVVNISDGIVEIDGPLGRHWGRSGSELSIGDNVTLFIRPEAMTLGQGKNTLSGSLFRRDFEGPFVNLFFKVQGQDFSIHQSKSERVISEGQQTLSFDPEKATVLRTKSDVTFK
jgi:spermidine/putrescine transport system ATP-binding protein